MTTAISVDDSIDVDFVSDNVDDRSGHMGAVCVRACACGLVRTRMTYSHGVALQAMYRK